MKINREKVASLLAMLLMLFSMASLITSQVGLAQRRRDETPRLNSATQTVIPLEPRLHTEDFGGARNPFHFSTEWQPLTPEPLELPALELERRPRVLFGWPADRILGSPIPYQTTVPHELTAEEGAEPAEPAPPAAPAPGTAQQKTPGGKQ